MWRVPLAIFNLVANIITAAIFFPHLAILGEHPGIAPSLDQRFHHLCVPVQEQSGLKLVRPSANTQPAATEGLHLIASFLRMISGGGGDLWGHSAALTEDGKVFCWGNGATGQV